MKRSLYLTLFVFFGFLMTCSVYEVVTPVVLTPVPPPLPLVTEEVAAALVVPSVPAKVPVNKQVNREILIFAIPKTATEGARSHICVETPLAAMSPDGSEMRKNECDAMVDSFLAFSDRFGCAGMEPASSNDKPPFVEHFSFAYSLHFGSGMNPKNLLCMEVKFAVMDDLQATKAQCSELEDLAFAFGEQFGCIDLDPGCPDEEE